MAFWHRRKDGFFERTDIIKAPSRTHVTSIQFEPDGDVVTADGDGYITVYSVDADGAYFVRTEFEAHNKGISCLIMLSEGTLLSGGEKDRRIIAWDSLQNYKRITETKVGVKDSLFSGSCAKSLFLLHSSKNRLVEFAQFTRSVQGGTTGTFTLVLYYNTLDSACFVYLFLPLIMFRYN